MLRTFFCLGWLALPVCLLAQTSALPITRGSASGFPGFGQKQHLVSQRTDSVDL